MIKKLAAVMLAAVMTTGTAAFAGSVSGVLTGSGIKVVTQDKSRLILNGYDENGVLVLSRMFVSDDGTFDIPSELGEYRLRAGFADGGEICDVEIEQSAPTAAPSETEAPSAEQTPEPEQTPSVTKAPQKTYPAIYERQVDAVNAIAVVNGVSYGEDENSEKCYYVDVMYQGGEIRLDIGEDITVSEASEAFSQMLGQDMSSLRKGDVICVSANLSGEINNVGFVYRPQEDNIATDGNDYGTSFEKLISKNGKIAGRSGWSVITRGGVGMPKNALAFGAISERTGKSLVLLGADGDTNEAFDLSLDDDTIVYVCDMSDRKELSIKNISGISKSSIPKNAEDENGFIAYSDEYKMNYALVRVVNGTVTDAVIYANYNR